MKTSTKIILLAIVAYLVLKKRQENDTLRDEGVKRDNEISELKHQIAKLTKQ